MPRIIFILVLFILFAACGSLSTQGGKVSVTSKPDRIEGCEFMGRVESSSILIDLNANGVAYNHARNELINEARELGANVILMSANSDTMGDAYRCKSPAF